MTEEQKNVIIKCRSIGLGYATIAKDIGLTKDAVVAFCRRNGLTGNMAGKAADRAGRCREFTAYGNSKRKYCSHACYIKDRFKGGGEND